jgi:hypothetical protein
MELDKPPDFSMSSMGGLLPERFMRWGDSDPADRLVTELVTLVQRAPGDTGDGDSAPSSLLDTYRSLARSVRGCWATARCGCTSSMVTCRLWR